MARTFTILEHSPEGLHIRLPRDSWFDAFMNLSVGLPVSGCSGYVLVCIMAMPRWFFPEIGILAGALFFFLLGLWHLWNAGRQLCILPEIIIADGMFRYRWVWLGFGKDIVFPLHESALIWHEDCESCREKRKTPPCLLVMCSSREVLLWPRISEEDMERLFDILEPYFPAQPDSGDTRSSLRAALEHAPPGFSLTTQPDHREIHFKPPWNWNIVFLLFFFCFGVTCMYGPFIMAAPGINGETALTPSLLLFCLVFTIVPIYCVYLEIRQTQIEIAADHMTFHFGRKTADIRASDIESFEQINDTANRNHPTWGLIVHVRNNVSFTMLYRQRIECSNWLGAVLAAWAGKPFYLAERRE